MRTSPLLLTLLCVLPAFGQVCLRGTQTLELPTEPPRIGLGWSTAASDGFLVGGLPFDEFVCRDGNQPCDPNGNTGGLAVFRQQGEAWQLERIVDGLFPAPGDLFGSAVDVASDQLLIGGAGRAAAGTVSVYARQNDNWLLRAALAGSDLSGGAGFGWSLARHEDLLVVGAPFQNGRAIATGVAHVFERGESGQWSEVARLEPNSLVRDDLFGFDVATDGEVVVVGAPTDGTTSERGSVYVFERSDGYTQVQRLQGNNLSIQYGNSVSISGERLAVGCPRQSYSTQFEERFRGAVFVYQRQEDSYVLEQRVIDRGGTSNDWFGADVALRGETLAVVAPFDDDGINETGTLVFGFQEGIWRENARLRDENGMPIVGRSVNVLSDAIVIGAGGANGVGRMHVVSTQPKSCLADVSGDCVVNLTDLATLLLHYGEQGGLLKGDLDGDGQISMSDLQRLLDDFGQGC